MNAPARAREFPEGIERRFALRSFIPAVLTKAVGSNGSDYATGTRGAFRATLTPPRPRQHTRSSLRHERASGAECIASGAREKNPLFKRGKRRAKLSLVGF